jgi:hypothetical protein
MASHRGPRAAAPGDRLALPTGRTMIRLVIGIVALLLVPQLFGCATVPPSERELLSDPIMIFDENPIDTKLREQHLEYHEGSVGGTGAQGGGCGCG